MLLNLMWKALWYYLKNSKAVERAVDKVGNGPSKPDPTEHILKPYRRGDYRSALIVAEKLRENGVVTTAYSFFRGSILAQLGQFEEAETLLRKSTSTYLKGEERLQFGGLMILAELLMQTQRYTEAGDVIDRCLVNFAEYGLTYRAKAQSYLMQGVKTADAVRLAAMGVEREKKSKPDGDDQVRKLALGECMATLAWATAVESSNRQQVTQLASAAVNAVGKRTACTTALVHCHLGRAFAEIGDTVQSTQHYKEAAKIDPHGLWGRDAMAAMNLAAAV